MRGKYPIQVQDHTSRQLPPSHRLSTLNVAINHYPALQYLPSKVRKCQLGDIAGAVNHVAGHLRLVVPEDLGTDRLSPGHHKERLRIGRTRVTRNIDSPGVFGVPELVIRNDVRPSIKFFLNVGTAGQASSDLEDHCCDV